MIGPGGLLLVVPSRICCPSFSFIGGVAPKEYITKTEMWKIFSQGHKLSTAEDGLEEDQNLDKCPKSF
jgi:hypothetical protein